MKKGRFLAILLAACMAVESTMAVFATETGVDAGEAASTPSAILGEADDGTLTEEAKQNPDETVSEDTNEGDSSETLPDEPQITPDEASDGMSADGSEALPEEGLLGTEEAPETEEVFEIEEGQMADEPADAVVSAYAKEPMEFDKSNGEELEIYDLKISGHMYGSVELMWSFKIANEDIYTNVLGFNIYRSTGEDEEGFECIGAYEYYSAAEKDSSGDFRTYTWEDTTLEHQDNTAKNKIYYYRVSVIYYRDESNSLVTVESKWSDYVTNEGWSYYISYRLGQLESDSKTIDDTQYIGGCIVDENTRKLEAIEIREGETIKLSIAYISKNGETPVSASEIDVEENNWGNWYICDQYNSYKDIYESQQVSDKIRLFSVAPYHEAEMTAIPGSARDDVYYLSMVTTNWLEATYMWQIPVHVVEGDGNYDDDIWKTKIYDNREELEQVIRDALVNRVEESVFYATGGLEWWDYDNLQENDPENWSSTAVDNFDQAIFDRYRERADMKPWEGDYLWHAMGDPYEELSIFSLFKIGQELINNEWYAEYVVTPLAITSKEQEEWVDDQINKIIYQPGGALYNYRNADDYSKIKAAFDYVRNNVSYIGTTQPIYHTCYSALKNKLATCEGYGLLYYRLLRELGIPNKILIGTDPGAHGYNIVKLGKYWYYADTTSGAFLQGENDFNHAELQSQFLTDQFKAEYTSKISKTSYNAADKSNDTKSKLSKPEKLTDAEICALDDNLKAVSSRMSADYTITGAAIKASGTVKYVHGCTGYLGYQEDQEMPVSGYFLAMKLKVEDEAKLTDKGYITISCTKDTEVQSIKYAAGDIKNGYVNVILNVTDDPEIKIEIDYDGDAADDGGNEIDYEAIIYSLDLSNLKKEEKSKSIGGVEEVSGDYGIESSSSVISMNSNGSKINVSYEAVAYSSAVQLPGQNVGESTPVKGNYVALQLNVPEAVKGTSMLEKRGVSITAVETAQIDGGTSQDEIQASDKDRYTEIGDDNSFVRFVLRVDNGFTKEFTVRWGGEDPFAFEQKLTVTLCENCILESLNENAFLPSSIAFNGLVSTMYVGQSQDVSVTFKKKYEQDGIQVFFTSSDSSVISVNRVTGTIRALKAGTANITVSAMDNAGKTIQKTATITVKALTAPASVKVSNIKDTSVNVSWKANTTGQYVEVYAIPYGGTLSNSNKPAEWKSVVENIMQRIGINETTLHSLDKDPDTEPETEIKTKTEQMLEKMSSELGVGSCVASYTASNKTGLMIEGLQPGTGYIFYVRNISETAASKIAFSGVISSKYETKSVIFGSIELSLKKGDTTIDFPDSADGDAGGAAVYEISEEMLTAMKATEEMFTISYALMKDGTDITKSATFDKVTFKSNNNKIVSLQAVKDTTSATLKFGTQVGDARIYVTGKDSSGAAWESDPIIIRKTKEPTSLKDKTTTLTIGQSVSIKELVGTDLMGSVEGIDFSGVNFVAALGEIEKSGCFVISYPKGNVPDGESNRDAGDAIITAAALVEDKSGKSVENIPFSMTSPSASAKSKITIKELAAPTISKVTVRDTSATIQFKPSSTVTQKDENYYYTLEITDTVTKEKRAVAEGDENPQYTCVFTPDPVNPSTVWTCEVKGLSSSKAYEAVVIAHYDYEEIEGTFRSDEPAITKSYANSKASKAKKFTTSKPLLVSEGSIDLKYIDLKELRKDSGGEDVVWHDIKYDDENGESDDTGATAESSSTTVKAGDDKAINLENNGTYVFMAQVSDLARVLETDKLKWAISSGDKKAGTIKATSSTFEMQLTTTKIGTFTVTATSTVTKQALATFEVNVIPYQSGAGSPDPQANAGTKQVAWLPETEAESFLKIKREDAA